MLSDSITALQNAATSIVNASNALVSVAATLKANAVNPADIAAIDAVTAQLTSQAATVQSAAS